MPHTTSASVGKSFIVKLHKILSENKFYTIIAWSQDGFSILIKSIPLMMEKVLPAIYKHQNYSSFVRQLNTYGFNKIPNEDGQHIYHHDHFNKHQKVDYSLISRKQVHREPSTTSSLQPELKQTVHNIEQRINDLELKMAKKQIQNRKFLIQRLLFLQKLNFQLQQKSQQQQKLISKILNRPLQINGSNKPEFHSQIFKAQQLQILNQQIQVQYENKIQQKYSSILRREDEIPTVQNNVFVCENELLNENKEQQILDQGEFLLNKQSQFFSYL